MTVERVEYGGGSVVVYRADVRVALASLDEGCVQCCVTSPPYWGLRAYGTEPQVWATADCGLWVADCEHVWGADLPPHHPGQVEQTKWKNAEAAGKGQTAASGAFCYKCGAWRGELGHEPTSDLYVEHLVEVFRGVRRVLRDDGCFWLNIDDSYDGQGELCNVPHRLAEALRADGWRWRQTVIWPKAAPMPESVKGWRWERCRVKAENGIDWIPCPGCDKCRPNGGYVIRRGSWRCTTAHEYIFMFVKSDRYFCDGEAVKEPFADSRMGNPGGGGQYAKSCPYQNQSENQQSGLQKGIWNEDGAHTGANPRSVWRIKGEPSRFKHYASFPSGLPRRCIQASTSEKGCCPKCGTPWAPVVEWQAMVLERSGRGKEMGKYGTTCTSGKMVSPPMSRVLDYRPACSCPPADPVPCVVLDPFAGTGTTLAVAVELGQRAIGIELNPEYLPMIRKRIETAVEARRIVQGGTPLTGDPARDAAVEGRRTFF